MNGLLNHGMTDRLPKIILLWFILLIFIGIISGCENQNVKIKIPDDAPKAWPPEDAVKSFKLPTGFRIELVASEPLISDPTSLCWDAKGDLYVGEHHGYNLPGQLEIEDWNKRGKLDTVVQRVKAEEKYYQEAKEGTYGLVKRLIDTDGDGVMDKSELFADGIPPVYGLTAARNGIIVAGQNKVIYLEDRDGDGKAEIKDTLFTGWAEYELERGISMPQWGMDGWIYFGSGIGSVDITGPYLNEPVHIPNTNFRIRADGSAIEPVTGRVKTIGFAINADGYLFTGHSTYSIPIAWKYLIRNPDFSVSALSAKSTDNETVFPLAPVHPWRLIRSKGKWGDYYKKRYGEMEATVSGYFTGECCDMIYHEDTLFPPEFQNNLFVAESAEKLIHRQIVEKDGTGLKTYRAPSEQKSEFIASVDTWFSPVGLAQGPDGSIYICDFYREIIEDYSAVPRPMQQLYQLNHGMDKGRIYRVSPEKSPPLNELKKVNLSDKSDFDLEKELDNPHFWHRNTANRLLFEKQGSQSEVLMKRYLQLKELNPDTPEREFIQSLRIFDDQLKTDVFTARRLAIMVSKISNERKLLQLALSLGYSGDNEVFKYLVYLARNRGNIRWIPEAILTGIHGEESRMALFLIKDPGLTGRELLGPLCSIIGAKGEKAEIVEVLRNIAKSGDTSLQSVSLKGIVQYIKDIESDNDLRNVINVLLKNKSRIIREQAVSLALALNINDLEELSKILNDAKKDLVDKQASVEKKLYAISLLSASSSEDANMALVSAWREATVPIRAAIFEIMVSSDIRLSKFVEAIISQEILPQSLSESQHKEVLEKANIQQREQLKKIFSENIYFNKEEVYAKYVKALYNGLRDKENGGTIFQRMCAVCHQVGKVGTEVGPNLARAYGSSEESLLQSILWPNDKITSGYETYVVTTKKGEAYSGILAGETDNSIALRQVGGFERTFKRKDVESIKRSENSIMPSFEGALTPKEVADILEWFKAELR